MSRHDVTKSGDFYNGGLWGNFSFFVGNFVSGCINNVDTHPESFSSKKHVIKKLSPKGLWQTYMKWTVDSFEIGSAGEFSLEYTLLATLFRPWNTPYL